VDTLGSDSVFMIIVSRKVEPWWDSQDELQYVTHAFGTCEWGVEFKVIAVYTSWEPLGLTPTKWWVIGAIGILYDIEELVVYHPVVSKHVAQTMVDDD
jgi:hypothetical protein